jgi:hypothetical protein
VSKVSWSICATIERSSRLPARPNKNEMHISERLFQGVTVSWCSCLIVYPLTNFFTCNFGCFYVLSCLSNDGSYFRHVESLCVVVSRPCRESRSPLLVASPERYPVDCRSLCLASASLLQKDKQKHLGHMHAVRKMAYIPTFLQHHQSSFSGAYPKEGTEGTRPLHFFGRGNAKAFVPHFLIQNEQITGRYE